MIARINKIKIFNFLKAESIVQEISSSSIKFLEHKNEITSTCLQEIEINNLVATSTYWKIDPETFTFLQLNGKKVDGVILEQTYDGFLNIILVELKSKTVTPSAIVEKFEKTLSWIYLLLNLLGNKENQKIRVFGIMIAQINKNWNHKETLNIFSSTNIRYIKRSFYTEKTSDSFSYTDLINLTVR